MAVTPQGGLTAPSVVGGGRSGSLDARRHRAELLGSMHQVERAIAVPVTEREWRGRVSTGLTSLRQAFAEHVSVTEGASGLYAELSTAAPRLTRTVRVLVREHAVILRALDTVAERLADGEIDAEQVRGWVTDLLRELSRHRQRGADLVYEAYATDIGGET